MDQDKRQTARNSVPVELTDIPVLATNDIPWTDRMWEELNSTFWPTNPIEIGDLTENQLLSTLEWAQEVNEKLKFELETLEDVLRAEWALKEQVLDQLLIISNINV